MSRVGCELARANRSASELAAYIYTIKSGLPWLGRLHRCFFSQHGNRLAKLNDPLGPPSVNVVERLN